MSCNAVVAAVEKESLAEEAGIRAGDVLLAINGQPVRDLIDYRFLEADDEVDIEIQRAGGLHGFRIEKDYDEDLGLEFDEALFDGIRRCANKCLFCFVDQLPTGLRKTLYVKDDDYRLSFLHGNFVTLTNLKEADWERIAEQRLSPLFVSVHATDPELRRKLLGNPKAPDILKQIGRLQSIYIEVHAQVVLAPGVNDGPVLEKTIADLAALENVRSIGVVPVGLTKYCRHDPARGIAGDSGLRRYRPDEARAVLASIRTSQGEFRKQRGVSLVYASDEFYLLAREKVPGAAMYDGFPQLENGIGMVRKLLDDWTRTKRKIAGMNLSTEPAVILTGTLAAPVLENIAAELATLSGVPAQVVALQNSFLGESVTVSGLLSGADILEAAKQALENPRIFIPRNALDSAGVRFLDDMTLLQMEEALGRPITPVGAFSEVVRVLGNQS